MLAFLSGCASDLLALAWQQTARLASFSFVLLLRTEAGDVSWEEAVWFAVSLHVILALFLQKCSAMGPWPEQGPSFISWLTLVPALYHLVHKLEGP